MKRTSLSGLLMSTLRAACGAVFLAGSADAAPVDGKLEAFYGSALSVQSTQTSLGDSPQDLFFGAELDQAFGVVASDTLWLLVSGNFSRFWSEPLIFPSPLQLYIDSQPGGQDVLSAANPDVGGSVKLPTMSGLRFDTEFVPDYWFTAAREASGGNLIMAFSADLPAGGGGVGRSLGSTTMGGSGVLSGGTNPFGVLVNVDPSNAAGVTAGCGASSGAGVTTGFEWAIPLAAIGNPTGTIRICALLVSGISGISNQFLGALPPGACALGAAAGVDLSAIAGPQYFSVSVPTHVRRETWGQLRARFR